MQSSSGFFIAKNISKFFFLLDPHLSLIAFCLEENTYILPVYLLDYLFY